MATLDISPPHRIRTVVLELAGETPGPDFFILRVGWSLVPDRFFGDESSWSNDFRYLALQEWLSIEPEAPPHTVLTILDFESNLETTSPRQKEPIRFGCEAIGGFLRPAQFDLPWLHYIREYLTTGVVERHNVNITTLQWRAAPYLQAASRHAAENHA